jgi:HlyD family secretion protein
VLLTVADMSVIEAEVEVDETDIPSVQIGQPARRSRSTPCPTKTFTGKVTEIGNSPIQAAGPGTGAQATNFKVVVTLDEEVPDVRPASRARPRSRRPRAKRPSRCRSRR